MRGLKDLSARELNLCVQDGIHSSIVDARVALALFLFKGRDREPLDFMTEEMLTGGRRRRGKRRGRDENANPKQSVAEELVAKLGICQRMKIEDDLLYSVNLEELRVTIQEQVAEIFQRLKCGLARQ